MPRRGRFLLVTWDGGGNLPPMLGIGRMLVERGHSVHVLAWNTSEERVRAAGCAYSPFLREIPFDLSVGRSWEEQTDEMYEALMCGIDGAREVIECIERDDPDVVVVDLFLAAAFSGAIASGRPAVLLTHVQRSFYDFPESQDPESWGWDFAPLNETRGQLGLEPLSTSDGRVRLQLMAACTSLITLAREFESPELPVPEGAVHVGAIFEQDGSSWNPPWPEGETRVLVAFSSTYMHHEPVLERVVTAVDDLGMKSVVTLGHGLGADEITAPASTIVLPYVPHREVLPHVSLVVTHAGLGTVNVALEFGVPMVCMPMGRDQFANAERVVALGCGLSIEAEASVDVIRAAISGATRSASIRDASRRMAAIMRRYERGRIAVRELEGMLAS